MEELKRLAEARDKAAMALLTELRIDVCLKYFSLARIAEYIEAFRRDHWANQNAGSERE